MHIPLTAAIFSALLGCQHRPEPVPLEFADDIDQTFDFSLQQTHTGTLHQPYTVGASFNLFVVHGDYEPMSSWYVTTPDYEVIRFLGQQDSQDDKVVRLAAMAPGEAEIEVRSIEDDALVGGVTLEVVAPDAVQLHSAGLLFAGSSATEVDGALLRTGDPGRFMVEFYGEGRALHGYRALRAIAPEGVELTVDEEWNGERRDWLTVQTEEDGTYAVELFAGDYALGTLQVESLPKSSLVDAELLLNEGDAADGEALTALALTSDDQGREVTGVEYGWAIDGEALDDRGDLFRYTYDPAFEQTLVASLGDIVLEGTIHARPGEDGTYGEVDSSSGGCSSVPSGPRGLWALLLGLVALRRRR
jgi:hypothetical protein